MHTPYNLEILSTSVKLGSVVLAARDLDPSRLRYQLNNNEQSYLAEIMAPIMSQPLKWLSLYEDFVAKNASSVGQVESALRSLTYIIPGKTRAGSSSWQAWFGNHSDCCIE